MRVTVDNDGKITDFHNSVKQVRNLSNKLKQTGIDPGRNGQAPEIQKQDIEKQFSSKLAAYQTDNSKPVSDEVGYDVFGLHGSLVAKREYEVTFENNLKKLIQVTVPIFA